MSLNLFTYSTVAGGRSSEQQAREWQQRYEQLQRTASPTGLKDWAIEAGANTFNFAMDTLDIMSRPFYAVGGVLDHAFGTAKQGEQLESRILGDLLGDTKLGTALGVDWDPVRDTRADLLRKLGVGEGGDILPDWVSEKLWGWDPTWRDAAGLGLDILTDPMTFMGHGLARGAFSIVGRAGEVHRISAPFKAAVMKRYNSHMFDLATRSGNDEVAELLGKAARLTENGVEVFDEANFAKMADLLERDMTREKIRGLGRLHKKHADEAAEWAKARNANTDAQIRFAAGKQGLDKVSAMEAADYIEAGWKHHEHMAASFLARQTWEGVNKASATLQDRVMRIVEREVVRDAPNVLGATLEEAAKGAYGLKFGGKVIVPQEFITANADKISKATAQLMGMTKPTRYIHQIAAKVGSTAADTLDFIFNRDNRFLRQIPGAKAMFQQYRDNRQLLDRKVLEELRYMFGDMNTNTPEFHLLTRAIDNPDDYLEEWLETAKRLFPENPDKGQFLYDEFNEAMERVRALDIQSGIVTDLDAYDRYRGRYVPHMTRADIDWGEQFGDMLENMDMLPEGAPRPSVGTFAEKRRFKTIDDHEKARMALVERLRLAGRNADAQRVAEAEMVLDPQQLFAHRVKASQEAYLTHEFFTHLQAHWAYSKGVKVSQAIKHILEPYYDQAKVDELWQKTVDKYWKGGDVYSLEEAFGKLDGRTRAMNLQDKGVRVWMLERKLRNLLRNRGFVSGIEDQKGWDKAFEEWGKQVSKIDPAIYNKVRATLDHNFLEEIGPTGQRYMMTKLQGKEYYLPEGIARQLRRMGRGKDYFVWDELKPLLDGYDKLTNIFKEWVTAPFISFHARNAYGNVAATALAIGVRALDPRFHMHAIKIMLRRHPKFRNHFADGTIVARNGVHYTYEQVDRLMSAHNVQVEFAKLAEVAPEIQIARKQRSTAHRIVKAPVDIGASVGGAIETEARAMLFMHYLADGHTPADAARLMKAFIFDYDDLSEVERAVFRRLIPFYTWNSKNIRRQVLNVVENPGRVANLHRPLAQDRGSDEDMLPEYRRGELKIRITTGKNGELRYAHNIDLPFQGLQLLQDTGITNSMLQLISIINPLIKAPLELAFDREAFTGRQISGPQFQGKMGQAILDLDRLMGGHLEAEEVELADGTTGVKANGTKVYLFTKTFALSRYLSEYAKWLRLIDDKERAQALWLIGTGFDFVEYDLDEQAITTFQNRYRRLEEKMIEEGWQQSIDRTINTDKLKELRDAQRQPSAGLF
jgi:hypothetical protein